MVEPNHSLRRFAQLRDHVDPGLDERDVQRLVRGGADRRVQTSARRSLRAGWLLGATSLVLVLAALWIARAFLGSSGAPSVASSARNASGSASGFAVSAALQRTPPSWMLSDQSRAIALDAATELAVDEDAPRQARLRLTRGRARFEVTRRPERTFAVRAGAVTVSVVGTVFGVELVADRVGVSVEQGAVDVDWGVGQQRLRAGESGWFPPMALRDPVGPVGANEPLPTSSGSKPRLADSSRAGALPPETPSAQQLLREVDAARSGGQPERAVELLRQLLRERPDDPRAPLAAFTLGRVLLKELGRPREAAAAFHDVALRAPRSSFAEDALAREIEAWTAAGEPARARALATTYLERYPAGRHLRSVKALVGIE